MKANLGEDGAPCISGFRWDSHEALQFVKNAVGEDARLFYSDYVRHFGVLPLLVASDGAMSHMGYDRRRFRPNIVVGGVDGLEERTWPGRRLRTGSPAIEAAQLRGRCIMTTYNPDTLHQDVSVLRRIVHELDGTVALDCAVVKAGSICVGDTVTLLDE